MAILILLALFILVILFYLIPFVRDQRRIGVHMNKIPGPPGLPILGNVLDYLTTPDELWNLVRTFNDKYYPIYKIWNLKWAAVNVRHPDDIEILLSSHKNITKSILYDFLFDWFGTGLLTSTDSKWQHRRKILTPAFHFNVLREFADIFDQEGLRMVEELKSKNARVTVDLLKFVTKYTLNAICETAMGTSLAGMEASREKFQQVYRKSVHDMGHIMLYRVFRPWLHPKVIFGLTAAGRLQKKCLQIIRGFSKKIIGERKKYHEDTNDIHLERFGEDKIDDNDDEVLYRKNSKKKLAMLDLLIAAMRNGHIDDNGIWEEVDTFMFEGHDTTAMGICFTLLLLAEHTSIQERVRAEVDEILKNNAGRMGINELQQLNYLERCIKEALRLYPSVPFISRFISSDIKLTDYTVPHGALAHIHIYDLHRDPNYWPDPLCYDPDRFLPDRIQGRHPFSYIPFSGGPRNCIGQKFAMLELKAMIGHLIHNFYLVPVDLAHEIRITPDLVLRPRDVARVQFVPR